MIPARADQIKNIRNAVGQSMADKKKPSHLMRPGFFKGKKGLKVIEKVGLFFSYVVCKDKDCVISIRVNNQVFPKRFGVEGIVEIMTL